MSVRLFAGGALALLLSVTVFAQANERVLYVSAWDEKTRAPLTGLGVEAFAVREDDKTREVLRVSAATSPMAIAILVDNSQAARNHITEIRRALTSFVRAVEGLGPVSIIGIADRPTVLADYTTELKQLDAGIGPATEDVVGVVEDRVVQEQPCDRGDEGQGEQHAEDACAWLLLRRRR